MTLKDHLAAIGMFTVIAFNVIVIGNVVFGVDFRSHFNDLKQVVEVAREEGIKCAIAEDGSPEQIRCGLVRYMKKI